MRGNPEASSAQVRRRMQATRQRDTNCEIALRSALFRLGLRYRTNFRVPGTRGHPDVAFTRAKVAVFVDGCFWHGCPKHGTWPQKNGAWWRAKIEGNMARDKNTDAQLRSSGWRVIRIWAHQDPGPAAKRIEEILRNR
jgi:DNA mismatch endonuclease (patch repair protein)